MSKEDTLTASEALYGFAGWLTSREEPVVFSCRHDAAIAAELVDEYCRANELAEPRPWWADRLRYPKQPEPRPGLGGKINAPFHDEPDSEPDAAEPECVRCPVCRGLGHDTTAGPSCEKFEEPCDHCNGSGEVVPVQQELFGGDE